MHKKDFYFDLPEHLIAQTPSEPRDSSRLLKLNRRTGALSHYHFNQLPTLLRPGDLLVANNSKVLPARLLGAKEGSGGACELLLLKQQRQDEWECLARPGRRLQPGARLVFGDGSLQAEVVEVMEGGNRLVRFSYNTATLYEKLEQFGKMPLPPYIRSQLTDNNQYQTVYAKQLGSAAAPTAGLHFTDALIDQLKEMGVGFTEVTLHVGLGTFRPVKEERIEDHPMHSEWYSISQETADAINKTKADGGRIISVGTTSCRSLEAAARATGTLRASSGDTDIFLYPGCEFKMVDGLITNFHLPESTLIMLVSAFCGRENTLNAYKTAIEMEYRFFSFGDAMLII